MVGGAGPRAEAGPKLQVQSFCICDRVRLPALRNCARSLGTEGGSEETDRSTGYEKPAEFGRRVEDQKEFYDPVEHQWGCLLVMTDLFTFLFSISPIP